MTDRFRRRDWHAVRTVRRREATVAAILATAAVALVFDALDAARPFNVGETGALDEPAHLALTVLVLFVAGSVLRLRYSFVVAALIASIAIDLDHVPLYLGVTGISAEPGGRPYTHSLLTVAVAAAVALWVGRWRVAATGVVVGLASHFVRDVCEGPPGVSLLWPVSPHAFVGTQTEFRGLVAALVVLAIAGAFGRNGSRLSRNTSARPGGRPAPQQGSGSVHRSRS